MISKEASYRRKLVIGDETYDFGKECGSQTRRAVVSGRLNVELRKGGSQ